MMDLTFLLSTAGFTMIMVRSKIMMPLREWVSKIASYNNLLVAPFRWLAVLLGCELCFSYWSGMIMYFLINRDYSVKILIFGFVSSGFVYLYTKVIQKLDGTSCKN